MPYESLCTLIDITERKPSELLKAGRDRSLQFSPQHHTSPHPGKSASVGIIKKYTRIKSKKGPTQGFAYIIEGTFYMNLHHRR